MTAAITDADRQVEISRILGLRNSSPSMFQILGVQVDESTTMSTVKKAYFRLALHTHPDKTSLPGAADAFALVERAFKSFPSDAVLERFKQAELKKNSGAGAALPAVGADANSDAARQEAMRKAIQEEYLKARRETEEKDRRRQREETESKAKQQQVKDIQAGVEDWKKFRHTGSKM